MGIEELEIQISNDRQKLSELVSQQGEKTTVVYNDSGEVKYHTMTNDNDKEIVALRQQIMVEQRQLDQMKQNKEQYREHHRSELEKNEKRRKFKATRKKREEAERRKIAFKEVKKRYKSLSMFQRLTNKKPNFKKISKLSSEELNFLISLSSGNTTYQVNRNEQKEKNYRERDKYTESEIRKMINERNRQDFQHALSDPSYLQEQIESEEMFKGRSM